MNKILSTFVVSSFLLGEHGVCLSVSSLTDDMLQGIQRTSAFVGKKAMATEDAIAEQKARIAAGKAEMQTELAEPKESPAITIDGTSVVPGAIDTSALGLQDMAGIQHGFIPRNMGMMPGMQSVTDMYGLMPEQAAFSPRVRSHSVYDAQLAAQQALLSQRVRAQAGLLTPELQDVQAAQQALLAQRVGTGAGFLTPGVQDVQALQQGLMPGDAVADIAGRFDGIRNRSASVVSMLPSVGGMFSGLQARAQALQQDLMTPRASASSLGNADLTQDSVMSPLTRAQSSLGVASIDVADIEQALNNVINTWKDKAKKLCKRAGFYARKIAPFLSLAVAAI